MEAAERKEWAVAMALRGARRVVALTGAGISAESGVPTFRGEGGLWRNYRPEDLATPEAFQRQPELVWEWYNWRRRLIGQCQPNPGHLALARLETRIPGFVLITQNVDGLHRQAGSTRILELHGNIMRNRCIECGEVAEAEVQEQLRLVYCACGGLMRPDVVWFGETLPDAVLDKAFAVSETADVFLSVGTSALVYPAASLPYLAQRAGGMVVEINLEETPLSATADLVLRGSAGEVLPRIVHLVESGDRGSNAVGTQ